MIHQYQNNGYSIVLDVNSGCVHVVDQMCYDLIACLDRSNPEQTKDTLALDSTWNMVKEELGQMYDETELREALSDIAELTANGQLFTKDIYEDYIEEVKKRCVYILPMTVISHASIVLQKRENIMEDVPLCRLRSEKKHWIF